MWMASLVLLASNLVINEILYDPPGADGGQEFVEVFNADSTAVAWSTLSLETGDGARPGTWRRVWEQGAGSLASAGLWVVGGADVVEADGRLTGTLQNGPDALRLLVDGRVVDLVGYGALTDAELFETSPAADVSSQSLARLPDGHDTQNNRLDLVARAPSPGRRNLPQHEWQLQILEPPWHRLWPGRHVRVHSVLRNLGTSTTRPGDWQLRAFLQRLPEADEKTDEHAPAGDAVSLNVQALPAALAVGDSALVEVGWIGESGLFSLVVESQGQDEWAADNRDTLLGRVGSGPVIINEILFAPLSAMPEWVELWNRSSATVDLDGWTLQDASGRVASLHSERLLPPDGFAVLLEDPQVALGVDAPPLFLVTTRPWPSLNNSDDEQGIADILTLRDADGLLQDAVFYSGAQTVRGRSLERVHADADVRGVLWGLSKSARGATPGAANSIAGGIDGDGFVEVTPNPVSPDGDGVGDVVHIRLRVPENQEGFRARLFDLEGRLRRDLAADRLGPGERHLLWDGTDDSGLLLEMGVYLLHLEFFGKSSTAQRLVRTVGVVRP